MRKSYKFKAKINNQTEANTLSWLNLCCELYNAALEERINKYKCTGKSLSVYDQNNSLPKIKEYRPEFKYVDAQVLQDVLGNLGKAYDAFFRRIKLGQKPGFPRFKSNNRFNSFTLKQNSWKLDGRNLHIRNVGRFKLYKSRNIEGDIKTITIKRDTCGDWYVTFSCDNVPIKSMHHDYNNPREVGVDVGIEKFLTTSDGDTVENHRHMKKAQKSLRLKQRALSRKKNGSNRRNKQRACVAKLHRKVARQRDDHQWKTAKELLDKYDRIFLEDLNINNMLRNRYLASSISDVAWGSFIQKLIFKAEEAGKEIIKVNPRNTSQICSGCGRIVKKGLLVRIHKCPHCLLILDRDINAAINILRVGQTRQALTSSVAICVA